MSEMGAQSYDAIVLGAGPAGEVCAGRLGNAGWKVALVERAVAKAINDGGKEVGARSAAGRRATAQEAGRRLSLHRRAMRAAPSGHRR